MFGFFTVAYSQKLTFKLSTINICTKDGLSIFVSLIMVSGYSKLVKWKLLSRVWLFATLWTVQSMEFSSPEYWSGQPFPSPGDFPNPGIEPRSLALWADSLPAEPQGKPKNTGVDSLSLVQRIFLTQELNWGLLITGGFLTSWATREVESEGLINGLVMIEKRWPKGFLLLNLHW